MRSAAVVVAALVLTACSKSSTGPGAGFECLGKPLPTTAPNPIHVGGQTKANAVSPTALQTAAVAGVRKAYYSGAAVYVISTIVALFRPTLGLLLNVALWIVWIRLSYRAAKQAEAGTR